MYRIKIEAEKWERVHCILHIEMPSSTSILRRTCLLLHTHRNASTITIPALVDSHPIEATHFAPSSPSSPGKGTCVVISQATGNRRQFYSSWAEYLSKQHDLHVLTYDYRGTHVRKPTEWTLVEHWARRDCAGILSHCFENYDQVVHVGHSLGGNLHALLPPAINQRISRILLVSAASSYLMYHKWNPAFLRTLLSLYVIREPLIWAYGYYPMRTVLRSGVDMPRGIIRQWARWTRHRECFVDDQGRLLTDGFNSVRCPILAVNFADDEFYTQQAFNRFTDQFQQSSNVQRWHLPKGGHFNFFKEKHAAALWKDIVPFLKSGETHAPNTGEARQ
jgi:predicted alpha/beta hydrolase